MGLGDTPEFSRIFLQAIERDGVDGCRAGSYTGKQELGDHPYVVSWMLSARGVCVFTG